MEFFHAQQNYMCENFTRQLFFTNLIKNLP